MPVSRFLSFLIIALLLAPSSIQARPGFSNIIEAQTTNTPHPPAPPPIYHGPTISKTHPPAPPSIFQSFGPETKKKAKTSKSPKKVKKQKKPKQIKKVKKTTIPKKSIKQKNKKKSQDAAKKAKVRVKPKKKALNRKTHQRADIDPLYNPAEALDQYDQAFNYHSALFKKYTEIAAEHQEMVRKLQTQRTILKDYLARSAAKREMEETGEYAPSLQPIPLSFLTPPANLPPPSYSFEAPSSLNPRQHIKGKAPLYKQERRSSNPEGEGRPFLSGNTSFPPFGQDIWLAGQTRSSLPHPGQASQPGLEKGDGLTTPSPLDRHHPNASPHPEEEINLSTRHQGVRTLTPPKFRTIIFKRLPKTPAFKLVRESGSAPTPLY